MNSDSKYKKKLNKLSLSSEENSNRNSIGLRVTEAKTTAGQQEQQRVPEFWIHHQTRDDSIVSRLYRRHCRPIT